MMTAGDDGEHKGMSRTHAQRGKDGLTYTESWVEPALNAQMGPLGRVETNLDQQRE